MRLSLEQLSLYNSLKTFYNFSVPRFFHLNKNRLGLTIREINPSLESPSALKTLKRHYDRESVSELKP